MPFLHNNSFGRALTAATLLVSSFAAAQQCYYPDGSPSTDTPCSTGGDSSCCESSSFCLDNGLCFGGGIVSRGSCTDKTWGSEACAGYCKTDSPSGSISLTPCSDNGGSSTFVCGLDSSACSSNEGVFTMSGGGSFILRPAQVQALIQPVLNQTSTQSSATETVTSCPSGESKHEGMYTAAQMAGLGCGLGLPLLFAICAAVFLFVREKSHRRESIMEPDSYNFRPPPPPITIQHPAFRSIPVSRDGSEIGSMTTVNTSEGPAVLQSFLDRYQNTNNEKTGRVPVHRVELDGSPVQRGARQEARGIFDEGNRF